MSRSSKLFLLSLVLAAFALFAGCTAAPSPTPAEGEVPVTGITEAAEEPQVAQADLVFGMAVHANPAEDAFWAVVEKGAQDAAATYGVELRSGGNSDPVAQAQLVEDFIGAEVDGIFVSLANPDALRDATRGLWTPASP